MPPPRHLTNDDSFPPMKPGKLRLYSMQYCGYALRTRLLLEKHGVDFEVININLHRIPKWFSDKSPPGGTVPVIETTGGDGIIGGPLVTAEYIEDVYGKENKTLSTDPWEKAKTKMLIEDKFSKAISSVFKRLGKKENWQEPFFRDVGELEKILETRKFFAGDKITFADYMIWPWMRLVGPVIDDVLQTGKFKNLERWIGDMSKDETVKKCYTSPDILKEFCKGYVKFAFTFDLE